MYPGCDTGTLRVPGIAYVHGLGGDIGSWYRQVNWTDTFYKTACFGVDYGSSNYEVSFHTVANELDADLYLGYNKGIDMIYPNRCKLNDYVIAHSQGGIAARYLDRQWDVSTSGTFGLRKFYGLVTFGTPHAGAHIAYTKNDHYDFVQSTVRTVFLGNAIEGAYDLTNKFGFLIGQDINDITTGLDSLLATTLAPLMLSPQHTNTLDEMRPDHQTMVSLNSHKTKLRRVAFYGIEIEPECWRLLDNIVVKPSPDYDLWGAQPDDSLIRTVEAIRYDHLLNIAHRKREILAINHGPFKYPAHWQGNYLQYSIAKKKQIATKTAEINNRKKAVEFLDNANTYWRYIIGSYHKDSFTIDSVTHYELSWEEKYGWLGRWYSKSRVFDTYGEAKSHYNNLRVYSKKRMVIVTKTKAVRVNEFYPSDGVVLAKSQKAFPGITERLTDLMVDNNHMQERNSTETKRVLESLYDGWYDDFFKITP
jgi:hypothetical protein